MAKIYIFISPDGVEYKCEASLKKFADEHKLNYGLLSALGSGKRKEYKGLCMG
jgi:peroxiredoxin